jgi:hypothetical protein
MQSPFLNAAISACLHIKRAQVAPERVVGIYLSLALKDYIHNMPVPDESEHSNSKTGAP